jgi:hypothetical protein
VAVQAEQVEHLQAPLPPSPAGPKLQWLSVEGAFVPLVRQQWAEVKTLALGRVEEPRRQKGEELVPSRE